MTIKTIFKGFELDGSSLSMDGCRVLVSTSNKYLPKGTRSFGKSSNTRKGFGSFTAKSLEALENEYPMKLVAYTYDERNPAVFIISVYDGCELLLEVDNTPANTGTASAEADAADLLKKPYNKIYARLRRFADER